jgi:hypothetical protein
MPQLTWDSPNLAYDAPNVSWDAVAQPSYKTMPNDNKISATVSAQDRADILAAFGTIKAKLPFLINLTPVERRRMPSISTERGGMNDTFPMEMGLHADLVPTYVEMAEVTKDVGLWLVLDEITACAREVCEGIEDTKQAVGNDLYLAYLAFYNNVAQAAKRGVAGMDALYTNLRRYFSRGSTPPPPPPNP